MALIVKNPAKFSAILCLLHAECIAVSKKSCTFIPVRRIGSNQARPRCQHAGTLTNLQHRVSHPANGGIDMGDKGKQDKGQKENKKQPQHTLKEKRQIKKDKAKNKSSI
ncbi:MAG: hypothetical protein OEL75_01650 [Kiritimatiellaceae bacterium]|nr:hypothetical protein [Kiritimatiellaceae bacterium]